MIEKYTTMTIVITPRLHAGVFFIKIGEIINP